MASSINSSRVSSSVVLSVMPSNRCIHLVCYSVSLRSPSAGGSGLWPTQSVALLLVLPSVVVNCEFNTIPDSAYSVEARRLGSVAFTCWVVGSVPELSVSPVWTK